MKAKPATNMCKEEALSCNPKLRELSRKLFSVQEGCRSPPNTQCTHQTRCYSCGEPSRLFVTNNLTTEI